MLTFVLLIGKLKYSNLLASKLTVCTYGTPSPRDDPVAPTMLNRDYIGTVSPRSAVEVEAGQLRLFNKAVGETRNIYLDASAARSAGFRSMLAPPTFGTCLDLLAPQTGPSFEELGIDYRFLLHGEEAFEYLAPICAGDVITIQTTIDDIYEKNDGALEFMATSTSFTNQDDIPVLNRRRVLIMRNPNG